MMIFTRRGRVSVIIAFVLNCAVAVLAATEGITDGLFPSLFGGGVNVVFSPIVDVDTSVNSPSSEATPPPPSSGLSVALPTIVRVRTSVNSSTTVIHEAEELPATQHQERPNPKGVTVVIPSLLQVKTTVTTTPPSNAFTPASVHGRTNIDIAGLGALGSSVMDAVGKPFSRMTAPKTSTASSHATPTTTLQADSSSASQNSGSPNTTPRSLRGAVGSST